MTIEYYVEEGYVDATYFETATIVAGTAGLLAEASLAAIPLRRINLGLQDLPYTWDSVTDWDSWPRLTGNFALSDGRWDPPGQWLPAIATMTAVWTDVILDLTAAAHVSAQGLRIKSIQSTVLSAATVQVDQATRIRFGSGTVQAQAAVQALGLRIKAIQATMATTAASTIAARVDYHGRASIAAQFLQSTQATAGLQGRADLEAFNTVLSFARVISLDPDFTLTIAPESGNLIIIAELRTGTIEAESLRANILTEQRGLVVESETRQELVI